MQIYDKKRPFINRQILIDLKRMQELRDVDEVKNFIKDLFNSQFLCAMLSRGHTKTTESFSPYLLTDENEEYVFPIFTNELEILKGKEEFENYTVYLMDFQDILNIYSAIGKQISLSLAIDPFGTNFCITDVMLSVAKKTLEELENK